MSVLSYLIQIINLDFANDHVPYDVSVDVRDLVSLEVCDCMYSLLFNSLAFAASHGKI